MSAVGERGPETTTGNKSVEASSGEDNCGNTGTTPKTVSSCVATQTDASLQTGGSDESHDVSRRAVRDRDILGPSGVYVRNFADADLRTRRPNINRQDGTNLADFNIPGNYPREHREVTPQYFGPKNEFNPQGRHRNYFEPPFDNRCDDCGPYRNQNPLNNPNDQNSDSYPYPPATGNYRSRDHYPHVTFDPVLDSAPSDHGCVPEDRRFSRRGPPPPSPATAYDTMRRWNLKFSGARGEDPEDYILKIIEGRAVIPVAEEVILRLLPFFLSGIALSWLRSNQFRRRSFGQFAAAFRSRFVDSDFQFELRQEIHRRTQGEREPAVDYLTCMIALFDRLEPRMTEADELSYAHRNLLLRLQLAIPRGGAVNLTYLEQLAVSVEKTYRVAKAYKPPPTTERSLLPNLAYREPRGRNRD